MITNYQDAMAIKYDALCKPVNCIERKTYSQLKNIERERHDKTHFVYDSKKVSTINCYFEPSTLVYNITTAMPHIIHNIKANVC